MNATAARQSAEREPATLAAAFAAHWPEYLMESFGLAAFMVSACVFVVLLDHPSSPLHMSVENAAVRRAIGGLAMGATAVAIALSPWGKRSGAHLNPSFTLAFASVGKIAWRDALFYIAAQFAGGLAGAQIADLIVGSPLRHSAVDYAITRPGMAGATRAFLAEFLISALMMITVLTVSNRKLVARFTPLFAGSLVALYIAFESPVSGMSMNPARTFGSAFAANEYTAIWIYFIAPPLGMLLAARFFRFVRGERDIYCAKLHHENNQRCIFRCRYDELGTRTTCKTETATT